MDLSKGISSQYNHHENANDVYQMIYDVFGKDTPPVSPRKIANVESNKDEICHIDVHVRTSNVNTYITNVATPSKSLHLSTTTIVSPEVPITKSIPEVGIASNIPENTSDVDSNVNMGVKFTIDASTIPLSSDIPLKVSFHHSQHSLMYAGILTQPITTLFSSQSTYQGKDSP